MERTRVFVEPTGRRIAPFDDPIGETLVLNRALREWQAKAFSDAGFVVVPRPEPPCLVVPDTLFAAGEALRAFVDGAAGQDAVLVLKRSQFGKWTTPVQPGVRDVEDGHLFEAIRFVSGRATTPRPVLVDPHERVIEFALPEQYTGDARQELALPRRPVMTLQHWVHILWANQVAQAYETMATPAWKTGVRLLWAALRARSANKWNILRKLSTRGKGCDVHPSAIVEGSTLGDHVTVGPNARILFSRIASHSTIGTDAQVEFSVLGERSWIPQQGVVRFSVLYPGAVATNMTQQSVFGRKAITMGSSMIDLNLEREVRVELDGQLYSSGQRFLGGAVGHGARVGWGVSIASGRAVPNGYLLVGQGGQAARKFPPGLEDAGPLVVRDGEVRPLNDPAVSQQAGPPQPAATTGDSSLA